MNLTRWQLPVVLTRSFINMNNSAKSEANFYMSERKWFRLEKSTHKCPNSPFQKYLLAQVVDYQNPLNCCCQSQHKTSKYNSYVGRWERRTLYLSPGHMFSEKFSKNCHWCKALWLDGKNQLLKFGLPHFGSDFYVEFIWTRACPCKIWLEI